MNKKYYMILDCETVTDARVPYDVAFILIDRAGNVIERFNALTAETMHNPTMRFILEKDNFSARKAGFYLTRTPAQVMPFAQIAAHVWAIIRAFDAVVVAYNVAFDRGVLNAYSRKLDGCNFFPDDCIIWDMWTMALYSICASRNYANYCDTHEMLTDKGNRKSGAEAVYSYLMDNPAFEEAHTALADCEIEVQIFLAILARKKKLHTDVCGCVSSRKPWREYLKA